MCLLRAKGHEISFYDSFVAKMPWLILIVAVYRLMQDSNEFDIFLTQANVSNTCLLMTKDPF